MEESLSDVWDIIKQPNLYNWSPSGKREIFEVVTNQKFPNLIKNINPQIQAAPKSPSSVNTKKIMPKHITAKLPKNKNKEKILKAVKKQKHTTCTGTTIRVNTVFS